MQICPILILSVMIGPSGRNTHYRGGLRAKTATENSIPQAEVRVNIKYATIIIFDTEAIDSFREMI